MKSRRINLLIAALFLFAPNLMAKKSCQISPGIEAPTDKAPYDEIRITVGKKEWAKIKAIRSQALKADKHIRPEDDFVKAKMVVNGDEDFKIKMRLKGDLGDHWKDFYKWSFRVNVRSKTLKRYKGMRKFSLQRPKTRNWYWEWLTHKIASMSDLATLKQGFVRLYVNGKDFGPYLIEQAFGEDVLTHNKHKHPNSTTIVKFVEDPYWAEWERTKPENTNNDMAYYKLPVKSYNIGGLQLQKNIRSLLEGYRDGALSPAEVFNLKKMANYMAVADLTGGFHGFHPVNLRFMWQSFGLEPVVCDTMGGYRMFKLMIEKPDKGDGIHAFTHKFFEDKEFVRQYRKALHKLSKAYITPGLIGLIEHDVKPIEEFLGPIDREYVLSVEKVLVHNSKVIKKYLERTK